MGIRNYNFADRPSYKEDNLHKSSCGVLSGVIVAKSHNLKSRFRAYGSV